MFAHDRADVGEVDVDEAGDGDQVADALHRLEQHLVGLRKASMMEVRSVTIEQAVVGDGDQRVDRLLERAMPSSACLRRFALEVERLGHDADGERAQSRRSAR
jgi:hypothetical protein